MGIEELKRWHWVVIGAIVGTVLAYAWAGFGSDSENVRRVAELDFERDLVEKDTQSGLPLIAGIVVHPAQQAVDGPVNAVTYKKLHKDKQGRTHWVERRMVAPIPYRPAIGGRAPIDENLTIQKYLDAVGEKYDFVSYRYGWWHKPTNAMLLGSVAGAAVIGGVWPTLLNVMIGAGFGPAKREKKEHERPQRKLPRLRWFKRAASAVPVAVKAGASAEEQQRLEAVANAYEQNLEGAGVNIAGTDVPPASAEAAAEVRKLESGPLEQAAPIKKPGDDDEIEVKGEYYPVLIHHKKQHDGQQGVAPGAGASSPPTSDTNVD
jgi:hypothetical protein